MSGMMMSRNFNRVSMQKMQSMPIEIDKQTDGSFKATARGQKYSATAPTPEQAANDLKRTMMDALKSGELTFKSSIV